MISLLANGEPWFVDIVAFARTFLSCHFVHVKRECNKLAHNLSKVRLGGDDLMYEC